MISHQMVRDVVAAKVVPEGALNLLCGGIGDLLDHVGPEDLIAFTGSSDFDAVLKTGAEWVH